MNVLGISASAHHSSAALVQDGLITAAIENRKLLRVDSANLPEAAIRFCVGHAVINLADLHAVSIAYALSRVECDAPGITLKLLAQAPVASMYKKATDFK